MQAWTTAPNLKSKRFAPRVQTFTTVTSVYIKTTYSPYPDFLVPFIQENKFYITQSAKQRNRSFGFMDMVSPGDEKNNDRV